MDASVVQTKGARGMTVMAMSKGKRSAKKPVDYEAVSLAMFGSGCNMYWLLPPVRQYKKYREYQKFAWCFMVMAFHIYGSVGSLL